MPRPFRDPQQSVMMASATSVAKVTKVAENQNGSKDGFTVFVGGSAGRKVRVGWKLLENVSPEDAEKNRRKNNRVL